MRTSTPQRSTTKRSVSPALPRGWEKAHPYQGYVRFWVLDIVSVIMFVVDVVAVAAAVAVAVGFRLRRFARVGRLQYLASVCDPTLPMVGHPTSVASACSMWHGFVIALFYAHEL